jgi:autotransporter-associated beta strand protein
MGFRVHANNDGNVVSTQRRYRSTLLALISSTMLVPSAAHAGPLILAGDYIKIGLNDLGTLGYGGNTSPGILYDGTGTGTFNTAYDYLTPGGPFEGFVITGSNGASFSKLNNNQSMFGTDFTGVLTDYSGITVGGARYDNRAIWSGTYAGVLDVTHDYFFNSDSQKIDVRTTITARTDLTNLAFSRQIDPDAVAAPGDSSVTNNFRGGEGISANDLVYAEALASKYVLGLHTNSSLTHNSAVTNWTRDTASYLAGTNVGNGDNTIGLGFDIGTLSNGSSVVIDYSYIFGVDIKAAVGGNYITSTRPLADLVSGAVDPVFDGGTLVFPSPDTVALNLLLNTGGGTIDTGAHAAAVSGAISGSGALIKTGSGSLTLTGANSHTGGTQIQGGALIVAHEAALGSGDITLHRNSSFATGANMVVNQNLHVVGSNATFDTGAFDVTLAGASDGNACLIKTGSGRLTLTGAGSNSVGACVQQGVLSFNNVFTGNVFVQQGGTASGSGRIVGDMIVSGTLSPGNSPGQLVVAGSVTQLAGSLHVVEIDGRTTGNGAGHHDSVVLTGANSVYTAAGTVRPVLRGISGNATNSFTPQVGDLFQFVTAEGGVSGTFDVLDQPVDGLAPNSRFDLVYRNNAILLAVTPLSYASFGTSSNARAAGQVLDDLRGAGGTSQLTNGVLGLNGDRTSLALEQLSGSVHASSLDASAQTIRSMRSGAMRHLDAGASTGTSLWSTVARDRLRVKADATGQGYRSENYSITLGVDTHATSNLIVGTAFSYGTTAVRTANLGEVDNEHYHGLAYAGWSSQGSYLRGAFSAGLNNYKVLRSVALANGNHELASKSDGFSYGVDVEGGHRFAMGKAAVAPFVGIAHDTVERSGFSEGNAAAALRFAHDERNAWQLRGGATVSYGLSAGDVVLTPYARAMVTHELDDTAARINPMLGGKAMAVDAAAIGRTGVQGGVGLEALLSEKVSLSTGYRYSRAGSARQHALNAGLAYRW